MGTREFRLPDLGEGLTEADLVSWSVQVGDEVTLNQPLGEVETAKAQVELPSPFAGTITDLLAAPGETVAVGAPLVRFSLDGEEGEPEVPTPDVSAPDVSAPEVPASGRASVSVGSEAPAPERRAVLVGYGPDAAAPASRRRGPDAKPAARKRARELGIDLASVPPAGPVITVADVERDTRVPVAGVRRATAAAMVASATVPQVTEFVTVDVTVSMRMLGRLGLSSPLPLVARAVVAALAEQPSLNSSWDDASNEIVTHGHVNLGIAVATQRGLLVPTVKNAQTLSLRQLATAITDAADLARSGRATPADLRGGTFSITNIGVYGIDSGTPLVNPGEAAILCLGAVTERPWVVEHELAVRWVTTLGLSFDHRLVDGEQGSRFLSDVAGMLCDPARLLARL